MPAEPPRNHTCTVCGKPLRGRSIRLDERFGWVCDPSCAAVDAEIAAQPALPLSPAAESFLQAHTIDGSERRQMRAELRELLNEARSAEEASPTIKNRGKRWCVIDEGTGKVDYVEGQKCPWVVIYGNDGCMGPHACPGFSHCARTANEELLSLRRQMQEALLEAERQGSRKALDTAVRIANAAALHAVEERRTRERLRPYLVHADYCIAAERTPTTCPCGLRQALARTQVGDGWTLTATALPEKGEPVLAWTFHPSYQPIIATWNGDLWRHGGGRWEREEVTHWRPLLPGPDEDGG